jgi:uncharacterized membrane protein YozB (DUF420 family)
MQFSDCLCQRFTRLYRVVGRFYVAGVLAAAPLGFYIQFFEEKTRAPRSFSFAARTQATVWILTTAIAMAFIFKGNVQRHRQWMTRSSAIALVFLEVRVISGVLGFDDSVSAVEPIVWMCNIFSLFFADLILQLQELLRPRSLAASRTQPATR